MVVYFWNDEQCFFRSQRLAMVFFGHHRPPSPPHSADADGGHNEMHPEQHAAAQALTASVHASGEPGAAASGAGVLVPADHVVNNKKPESTHFWTQYIPGIEKYATEVS